MAQIVQGWRAGCGPTEHCSTLPCYRSWWPFPSVVEAQCLETLMRIAQVAPPFESVPPTRYGGTERVVSLLTEELVRRGHEVTLFASGDSRTSAILVPTVERALWHETPPLKDFAPYWAITLGHVWEHMEEFDVVHSHLDYFA